MCFNEFFSSLTVIICKKKSLYTFVETILPFVYPVNM